MAVSKAEAAFWDRFCECHPELDSDRGREAAAFVLSKRLADLAPITVDDASEEIARRSKRLLEEAQPPMTLSSLIQARRLVRDMMDQLL